MTAIETQAKDIEYLLNKARDRGVHWVVRAEAIDGLTDIDWFSLHAELTALANNPREPAALRKRCRVALKRMGKKPEWPMNGGAA